jgi:hypothetical protein
MEQDNRGHWKRQKAHPIEVPNSESPQHLQELIAARELEEAIKLMDKSVNCLFLELPESVANHNKEIWLNLKKIINPSNQK